MSDTSAGWLLDGKVRYCQPRQGFRSGIEPVLLAAWVPARPGERVLEAGTGAGAGLLCLAWRVPGIGGAGVERDPLLAGLARENLAANGFCGIAVLEEDIEALADGEKFAHAFANPPWHGGPCTPPSHPGRVRAKRGGERLAGWIAALARRIARRGTLTLILPAARVAEALAATAAAGCGSAALLPLWPRLGSPAKLVLVRAVRGGRGPLTLLAGLVLHGPDGRFTAEAEALLRGGAALAPPPRSRPPFEFHSTGHALFVLEVPEPLIGGDEPLHAAPALLVRCRRPPREHELENMEQLLSDLEVLLIAGLVESDQDLVREPARMARQRGQGSDLGRHVAKDHGMSSVGGSCS